MLSSTWALLFPWTGDRPPWTADPVLVRHKFTNAYRASDRVSQYLISRVTYSGSQDPAELAFRVLVFKLFNRIDTWELLERELGPVSWADYAFGRFDAVLSAALARGEARVFGGLHRAGAAVRHGAQASEPLAAHRAHDVRLPKQVQTALDLKSIYARVALPEVAGRRSRIKQIFTPTPTPIDHRYPPKWRLPAGYRFGEVARG